MDMEFVDLDSEFCHVYIVFPDSEEIFKCDVADIVGLQSSLLRKMLAADDEGAFYDPVHLRMNQEHFEHILALSKLRDEDLLTVDYYEREFGTSPALRDQLLELVSTSLYLGMNWLEEFSKALFMNNVAAEVFAHDIADVRVIVTVSAAGASRVAHVEQEVAAAGIVATVEPEIEAA